MVWVFLGDYPRLSQRLLLTSSVSWEKLSQLSRVWEHLTRAGPTTAVPWAHKGPGTGHTSALTSSPFPNVSLSAPPHLPSFTRTSCLPQDPCNVLCSYHPNFPLEASPPPASGEGKPLLKRASGPGAVGALLDDAEGSLLKVGSGRGETPGEGLLQSLHAPLTVLR